MDRNGTNLPPAIVREMINRVIKKMRYRKKVRADVRAELEAHFEDALADCQTPEEQENQAKQLIAEFGDTKVLAALIRRAKKRCRPVWVKVMIRTGQVAGLCVLYVLLCVSRLYIGKPMINVDTIARINEMARQGHDESLNAFPGIQAAAGLLTDSPDSLWKYPAYADMNDSQRRVMDVYLTKNKAALDSLTEALKKPLYWRELNPLPIAPGDTAAGMVIGNYSKKSIELAHSLVDQILSSGLAKHRELARILSYRAKRFCIHGQANAALGDAVSLVKFGHLVSGRGLLVEQLVGIAVTALGQGTILYVIKKIDPNEHLLAETYSDLEGLFDWNRPLIDYSIEKAMIEDIIQHGFTDDGRGNGRPLASSDLLMAGSPGRWWKGLLLFDYPDRKQVTQHIDQLFEGMSQDQIASPWSRRDSEQSEDTEPLTMYAGLIKSAMKRTNELQWRCKTGVQAMLTVLAIKHYQAIHGTLPETLDDVVTRGLLETLPKDFYSDGPLAYQRKSDTEFVLYSWGVDLKDDSGRASTNSKGEVRLFYPEGDWVFWPMEKGQ